MNPDAIFIQIGAHLIAIDRIIAITIRSAIRDEPLQVVIHVDGIHGTYPLCGHDAALFLSWAMCRTQPIIE